jgi:uncharacterized protein (DUF488 family)
MHRNLYTIGYEGAELSDFLRILDECEIELVVDIRDVPISRKKGFSKSSLSQALMERGIGYRHLKALGDPKPGREAMRQGNYSKFLEIFCNHLSTEAAQEALRTAVTLASEKISVLLCYERSPKECHRTIVAIEMGQAADFNICNIGINSTSSASRPINSKKYVDIRQTL